ncbi:MAG: glutamate formimidoyltransferase [Coriobacteriia bacterium]|nr:glutamate formimidoyltransferase [Coriobacteriia bacterium]
MAKIVECIPNFSEGTDEAILQALVEAATGVPGVMLLDWSADKSHNRSVFTLAGSPNAVAEAAFCLCKVASERIDLRNHTGEHPRMGATDVIPFVPLREMEVEDCVALSEELAERIWSELSIPVFLYESSARSPQRRNLAAIRKGQFEGMPQKLKQPEWAPDFGDPAPHPSAGVTAVGARMPLIAFNINLDTNRLDIANAIAKSIRGSSGGYSHCKAIGVMLEERGIAQVSMNMVDFEQTPLYRVFEAVRFEAARWGVRILGSEVIGLTPVKALADCAAYYLQLEDFDYSSQVLEQHLD